MNTVGTTALRLIKVVVALVFQTIRIAQAVLFRVTGRQEIPSLVVLMYHSVKADERDRFATQMNQLRRAGTAVYADFEPRRLDTRRFIAVTFDDAYQSLLENALPVLRAQQIPSTIFVPTKYIGSAPGWIVSESHRNARERLLTVDELQEVCTRGTLIGSHSVSHRALPELNRDEIVTELQSSRRVLEEALGKGVTLFALPYGLGNAEIVSEAVRAGYGRVFLSVPIGNTSNIDGALVGRIEVSPTDWRLEYALKIRGAYQWLPFAVAAKKRLRNIFWTAPPHQVAERELNNAVVRSGDTGAK